MISVEFYQNESENIVVSKDVIQVIALEGQLRAGCDIVDPSIICEFANNEDLNFNYALIPEFGNRWYYVTGITNVRNNIWEISLHCDVLMSFSDGIKKQTAVISRQEQEGVWNLYLNDEAFKIEQKHRIKTVSFPYGFGSPQFVLTLAGGTGSPS